MRYRNNSPFFRQAGDVIVAPGDVTPELDAQPPGDGWVPLAPAATAPAPEAPVVDAPAGETAPRKRRGKEE